MRKEKLINSMKLWDANSMSKPNRWRDWNYNSMGTSSAFDSSTWMTLGDSGR
jgi:hypothetical protein